MEQCYSGGFIDNFIDQYAGTQRRVIATASNGNEPSWGNGFSNAWTSGVARIDETRAPNFRADINSDNKISMWEAYNYSLNYDPSASPQLPVHEHPQYSAKNPGTAGTTQYFSSCPAPVTPRINLTRPNVVETWFMGYPRNISWSQTGLDSATVSISLWRQGAKQLDIATNVPASSGIFTWTIPTSLAPGNDYRINLSSVAPVAYDQSDYPFILATTAAPGFITVNSTPSGAWVYLDGYNQSKKTLATLTGVSPGSHNITVKLAGYYEQSSGIFVNPGKTTTLNFTMESTGIYEPPFGTMVITSTPTESEVVINGISTGLMTPLIKEVDPGTYAVTVKAWNYTTPANQSMLVVKGKFVSKDFTLTLVPAVIPLPGYVNPPTDPDHDGIYEDLNGNGRLDFADVVLYFNQMEWIATNEPVSAFDLNGNSRIDFADIVKLFGEI
jgi:PKD repeat protein